MSGLRKAGCILAVVIDLFSRKVVGMEYGVENEGTTGL